MAKIAEHRTEAFQEAINALTKLLKDNSLLRLEPSKRAEQLLVTDK